DGDMGKKGKKMKKGGPSAPEPAPMPAESWRQVSRLGSPLVNEVVIPLGRKDAFNASSPADDAQFAAYVVDPQLAKLLAAVYGITIPQGQRDDLVQIFATGIP